MNISAILASGTGIRMKRKMPKQFLLLEGKPVIIYSLVIFLSNPNIDHVVIGCHPDWIEHMNDLINQYCSDQKDRIYIVKGGKQRIDTINEIRKFCIKTLKAPDTSVILTHDAVRPFITNEMTNECIEATIKYGSAAPVAPAIDTIFVSGNAKTIDSIPDRSKLFLGQTPQCITLENLNLVFDSPADEIAAMTDCAKPLLKMNKSIGITKGDPYNIKITTEFDLLLAKVILDHAK